MTFLCGFSADVLAYCYFLLTTIIDKIILQPKFYYFGANPKTQVKSFRVICLKTKSSQVSWIPSQIQVKSSKLWLECNLSQGMWLEPFNSTRRWSLHSYFLGVIIRQIKTIMKRNTFDHLSNRFLMQFVSVWTTDFQHKIKWSKHYCTSMFILLFHLLNILKLESSVNMWADTHEK